MRKSCILLTVLLIVPVFVSSCERASLDAQHKCEDGLVTVERQPDVPAAISVLQVGCAYDLSEADLTIEMKSLNGKSITEYEVWAIKAYDGTVDAYKRILVHTTEVGNGASTYRDIVSVSLNRGLSRNRITNIKVYIESVKFSDGTGWHAPLSE